jgi:hypothetical protein
MFANCGYLRKEDIRFARQLPNTQAWLDHNSPTIVAQFILAIVAVRFLSSLAELRRCQDIES